MVAAFAGKEYTLDLATSVNFDEYMKAIGVSLVTRKLGNTLSSTVELVVKGDEYTYNTTSTFKNFTMTFKLGQEMSYETMDGRKVKSTFKVEGNKLVEHQVGDKVSTITREFSATEMKATSTVDGITSTRIYRAV